MRVAYFVIMLAVGTADVCAQSINREQIDTNRRGTDKANKIPPTSGRSASASLTGPDKHVDAKPAPADPIGAVSGALEPFRIPSTQLETVGWSAIGGWTSDDHGAAFEAFVRSCKAVIRGRSSQNASQFHAALQSVCLRAVAVGPQDSGTARIFFEQNFSPMRIARLGETKGLLTGYHEPILVGSRVATAKFKVPVYRKPPDLAQRNGEPYLDRTAIEGGALAGKDLEIVWLEDPTDLLVAEMEGSARIKLEDGTVLRVSYDGNNGWPYVPIEQILLDRKVMPKEKMTPSRIREWMQANPDEGKELRRRNKSFPFFRETGLAEHEEAVGAQGISLTPGRSIAVDRFIHAYGTPIFIEAELAMPNTSSKFQRLMVSQDTGGAIRGPARADLYFGSGEVPAQLAARVRHYGQFTMLIPRDIDPVLAGAQMLLPRARPQFEKDEDPPRRTLEKLVARAKHNRECENQRDRVQVSARASGPYSKKSGNISVRQTQDNLDAC